jgi:enolase
VSKPTQIERIKVRKVFDSRGSPTIEVGVFTIGGFGQATAPNGASRGTYEVAPYPKDGINKAIKIVEETVAPRLIGLNSEDQETIDSLLHKIDDTENFEIIGGNIAMAISLSVAKAAAASKGLCLFQHLSRSAVIQLPLPLGNVIGGGKHAGKNAPDIQEFLALPIGATSFIDSAWANICVHRKVRTLLEKADPTFTSGRGDEGAWAPNLSNYKALDILAKACENVSHEMGINIRIGLDIAASSVWNKKTQFYVYEKEGVKRDSNEQIDYALDLIKTYKLIYVEDPLHEDDYKGFTEVTRNAKRCLICGDDIFTTNIKRLRTAISLKAGNSIIIKPNQIGTLTDALSVVKIAREANYIPIASHRSGETCDNYLANLAVGYNCPIVKIGIIGGERLAKINELIRIEDVFRNQSKIAEIQI